MSASGGPRASTAVTFHKEVATREAAEAEVQGWSHLASRIRVPALRGRPALPGRHLLAYEDVFASGRCELLLGDVIALADRDPEALPRLARLVDGVCHDLQAAADETGRWFRSPSACRTSTSTGSGPAAGSTAGTRDGTCRSPCPTQP